ncbi:MAG TPA: hypothetical protein VGD77_07040 [Gemmatimonadaceae bacterium]
MFLAACARATGGSDVPVQSGTLASQGCDQASARVAAMLWPAGPASDPRLERADIAPYVAAAGQMLAVCTPVAVAAHQREQELGLLAAQDAVRKELAEMAALDSRRLAELLPVHAQHVRRYLSLTEALRGRSR